jgi:outer membrane protein OmpA-like peptidoglycan-associated protein
MRTHTLILVALALLTGPAWSQSSKTNPDIDRLGASLTALDTDPGLADLGALERLKARQALEALRVAKTKAREQALYLANKRVEAAQAAAQAELLVKQSEQLDRERDQIMLQASRRDAELARREAEQLHMQNLARQEEAERLELAIEEGRMANEQSTANAQLSSAQAAQARKLAEARARETELARKEAELASILASDSVSDGDSIPPMQRRGNSTVYTLAGNAFSSGSVNLTVSAQSSLKKLANIIESGQSTIRIEGFTDSQGADIANLEISKKRADAVKRVLQSAGVSAGRMQSSGKGKASAVADNGSAAGRARNRRVEITVN